MKEYREATAEDIVNGNTVYVLGDDLALHKKVIDEVLKPNDQWKAFYADDGCRYGLDGLYIKEGDNKLPPGEQVQPGKGMFHNGRLEVDIYDVTSEFMKQMQAAHIEQRPVYLTEYGFAGKWVIMELRGNASIGGRVFVEIVFRRYIG